VAVAQRAAQHQPLGIQEQQSVLRSLEPGKDVFPRPHLRVGLEDHFLAKSNADEVRRARALCEELGRPLASCKEAEEILGLPPRA